MNPTIKKRKREPFITYPSEAAKAHDPHTVDNIATDTSTSTPALAEALVSSSATLVEAQPTQSHSAVWMVQNLEQRVSALEEEEDFEKEGVETDEEPFEEVHMTEGKDEEQERLQILLLPLQFPLLWPSLRRPVTPQTQKKFLRPHKPRHIKVPEVL
ncbi:hypothetical protein HAX54_011609 [Datura stramonium]|uniref:Uncharacterized protein n=1 Tax=Datura stramonium TaxID=4076 RepID=A0ABS8TID1_DATST|nr:hypothetical protein [Datura stramonium]